jgi:hypothetical protein
MTMGRCVMKVWARVWMSVLFFAGIIILSGCSTSDNVTDSSETASAVFSIQWPDQTSQMESGGPHSDSVTSLKKVTLSEDCASRGVANVRVIVRDESNNQLASRTFACELGEGTVNGITTGTGRRFIVSGLGQGNIELYHGEKAGVTINAGTNDIGVIQLERMNNSLPVATITNPRDGSLFKPGARVVFNGSGEDAEDGALSGASLVWTSDKDGQIGINRSFPTTSLSLGTHTITLTATDLDGASGTDTIQIRISANEAPTASITSPSSGRVFTEGRDISFFGSGQDLEDGALSGASLVWTSNINGQIGTGTSFSISSLSTGTHTITLTVTDSKGSTGITTIEISIITSQAPTASITQPLDGTIITAGTMVNFSGAASDDEDGVLSGAALVWTSNIDGPIGTGQTFSITSLSSGIHTITLTATDSDGETGSDSETIRINAPPAAVINSPSNESSYLPGSSITFSGSGEDPEDGTLLAGSCVWTSSIDGQIGGHHTVITNKLSPGIHTITLTVTDKDGATGSSSIVVTVNTPPVATITAPHTRDMLAGGRPALFTGTGQDNEDGSITGASLVWVSDIDGGIGSGVSFSTSSLSYGTHIITLTVTDSIGTTGSASISVNIFQPRLPDTGQTFQLADISGEDADYTINAPSYTKLDQNANTLSSSATSWAMVRDNRTGLIWEIKTTDTSIHDRNNTFSWQDSQDVFIANLNSAAFGTYTDWRMPSIMEMSTVVDSNIYFPAINTSYFPNLIGDDSGFYWSATPSDLYPNVAWGINFYNGSLYDTSDIMSSYVFAVRGGEFVTGRFVNNGNGTITDTATGLMWQQATGGPFGAPQNMIWEDAIAYCEGLSLAGRTDWRLPNRNELQSLVSYSLSYPAINTTYFPDTYCSGGAGRYWSSTTYVGSTISAWTVDFCGGYIESITKTGTYYVRAVRGGQ